MKKWQKEAIEKFENMSGFEFLGKREIRNDKDFWEKWDRNLKWLRDMVTDVETIISPYSEVREDRI